MVSELSVGYVDSPCTIPVTGLIKLLKSTRFAPPADAVFTPPSCSSRLFSIHLCLSVIFNIGASGTPMTEILMVWLDDIGFGNVLIGGCPLI